jgi:hypothetical protein
MTITLKLRCHLARSLRWFSTRKAGTRPIIPASSQITQESVSFDVARGDHKQLLTSRITVDQCNRSRPPLPRIIRAAQIPIAQAAPPSSTSRGFLPWRFSDAGRRSMRHRPSPAGVRKPYMSANLSSAFRTDPINSANTKGMRRTIGRIWVSAGASSLAAGATASRP